MVEVLIASVLLSVILLATFGLVTQGVRRAYSAKQITRATVAAQAVLERANVAAPHINLGGVGTGTAALTYTFNATTGTLAPAAAADTTPAQTERTKWRTIVSTSELPAPSLVVTLTPLPAGRSFDTSAIVRIVVDVSWDEVFGGTVSARRRRSTRLQTFNIRSAT